MPPFRHEAAERQPLVMRRSAAYFAEAMPYASFMPPPAQLMRHGAPSQIDAFEFFFFHAGSRHARQKMRRRRRSMPLCVMFVAAMLRYVIIMVADAERHVLLSICQRTLKRQRDATRVLLLYYRRAHAR